MTLFPNFKQNAKAQLQVFPQTSFSLLSLLSEPNSLNLKWENSTLASSHTIYLPSKGFQNHLSTVNSQNSISRLGISPECCLHVSNCLTNARLISQTQQVQNKTQHFSSSLQTCPIFSVFNITEYFHYSHSWPIQRPSADRMVFKM